jgi:hypothetical protein
MNKREALIRQIAEEMAIENFDMNPQGFCNANIFNELPLYEKERRINTYLKSARIAVKHMATEFRHAWLCGYHYGLDKDCNYAPDCATEIRKRGLIPPAETGKEAAEDVQS